MRGIIEQVWENESRKGQKYLTVQVGGERYSVWDDKYFDTLQEGVTIDYDFRQSGNFKNMTDIDPVDGNGNGLQGQADSKDVMPEIRQRDSCTRTA